MASSRFWEDKKRAAQMSQELAGLKREVERFDRIGKEITGLKEILEVSAEGEGILREAEAKFRQLDKEISEIEQELYFSGKYDKGSAVLSVYAGAGGKDSEDWAALLLRMFVRYAERKGLVGKTNK